MLESLLKLDKSLFCFINSARNPVLDWVFSIFSAHICIAIVVIFISFVLIFHFKQRWWVVICLICASFLLCDRISVLCFKDVFERLRPSHEMDGVFLCKLQHLRLIYDYKGGLYGFVSSHATNVGSLSVIFAYFLPKKWHYGVFLWALIVCYSRIYCGYHYPFDVLCGLLLGIVLGIFILRLYIFLSRPLAKT